MILKIQVLLNRSGANLLYLSFDDALNDGVQGFVRVALDHPLDETRAPAGGLLHGHVQVVVGLLGSEVLWWRGMLSALGCTDVDNLGDPRERRHALTITSKRE